MHLDFLCIHLEHLSNNWHFITIGQVHSNKCSHLNAFQAVIYSFNWVFTLLWWPVSSSVDLRQPKMQTALFYV